MYQQWKFFICSQAGGGLKIIFRNFRNVSNLVCGEELKPHLTFGSNHVFKARLPLACLTGCQLFLIFAVYSFVFGY